jgi:alanine dehydrogenase
MNKLTYLIKRTEIEKVFSMLDYVSAVETAFRLYGGGEAQMPAKVYLSFDQGDLRCMPAFLPSMKIAGVKNVNVHPLNRGIPAVMATITLVDPDTGFPLAIMDGTHITKMRTGAAGGIGAKYLSREDSKVAGFIGAGVQAWTQLEALLITRPKIHEVLVYDVNQTAMEKFVQNAKAKYNLKAESALSVKDAVIRSEIVVATTPVRVPVVKAEYIRKGTHINAIGADAPGKQELDTDVLKQATIVVDNWEQAAHGGEINVALSKGMIMREDIYGDIGEIVAGKKPGRQSLDQITVFDSTGLAIQDICAAGQIYRKLTSDKQLAEKLARIDLLCCTNC